jgi:hypothetical protein
MKLQYFIINIHLLLNLVYCKTTSSNFIYESLKNATDQDLNFIQDAAYSHSSDKSNNLQNFCIMEPIEYCSCIEIFYRFKNLTSNIPMYDEQDIKTKFRRAVKYYHPDHLSKTKYVELNDINKPFQFLKSCQEQLFKPKVRKLYNARLKKLLENCSHKKRSEKDCRSRIMYLNEEVILLENGGSFPVPESRDFNSDMETLHVFLDDSGSMRGTPLIKAKNILQKLSYRLYEANTNIYFIGSRNLSRRILSDSIRLNEDNINSMIFNIWNAQSGSTYLWQFIWTSLESVICIDCEIVIITDGFDNMSEQEFLGPTGFDALMSKLKARNKPLPRVFVYCVSSECGDQNGTNYKELSLASGGYFCDENNYDECHEILNQPHAVRLKLKRYFQKEYFKLLEGGKVRELPWIHKDEL